MYAESTVLVCPTSRARSGEQLTRTYAMNATGHARDTADPVRCQDPDNYDAEQVHLRFDQIDPSRAGPLLLDSASAPPVAGSPPPTRTASVIDLRQPAHLAERLAPIHARRSLNHFNFDGSTSSSPMGQGALPEPWTRPLP